MFSPSEIQRADDLVGIEMPTVYCLPDAAAGAAVAAAGAAAPPLDAAGAVVAPAGAAGAAEPQLLSSTASRATIAIRSVPGIRFIDFSFLGMIHPKISRVPPNIEEAISIIRRI